MEPPADVFAKVSSPFGQILSFSIRHAITICDLQMAETQLEIEKMIVPNFLSNVSQKISSTPPWNIPHTLYFTRLLRPGFSYLLPILVTNSFDLHPDLFTISPLSRSGFDCVVSAAPVFASLLCVITRSYLSEVDREDAPPRLRPSPFFLWQPRKKRSPSKNPSPQKR